MSDSANVGEGTTIWHQAQVRAGAAIGSNCIIGKGVYVDAGVSIGKNVKIQNYACIYEGVSLEDGVFIGPHVCFTNDLLPRSINQDGSLKSISDWVLTETMVKEGASVGANATIVCGVTIGQWAMIGAGSVVTRDVPNFGLVRGNPARLVGFVDPSGKQLAKLKEEETWIIAAAGNSKKTYKIPKSLWEDLYD